VVVDGKTLLAGVPVTYLMFLDKQLVNVATFISKWPTLDTAKDWKKGDEPGVWQTPPEYSVRAVKVPFPFVKAEATDKHPAQVEVVHRDEIHGTWTKIEFSGAISVTEQRAALARVKALQESVKIAIQQANASDAPQQKVGQSLVAYLFG
jgi:hypothetical protein